MTDIMMSHIIALANSKFPKTYSLIRTWNITGDGTLGHGAVRVVESVE